MTEPSGKKVESKEILKLNIFFKNNECVDACPQIDLENKIFDDSGDYEF
jgi:hypothetical protein